MSGFQKHIICVKLDCFYCVFDRMNLIYRSNSHLGILVSDSDCFLIVLE